MKETFKLILLMLGCALMLAATATVCVLVVTGFIALVGQTVPNATLCIIAIAVLTVIFIAIFIISMIATHHSIKKQILETKKKGEEMLKAEAEKADN